MGTTELLYLDNRVAGIVCGVGGARTGDAEFNTSPTFAITPQYRLPIKPQLYPRPRAVAIGFTTGSIWMWEVWGLEEEAGQERGCTKTN